MLFLKKQLGMVPNVDRLAAQRDIPGLIQALKHPYSEICIPAMCELGRIGQSAIEPLVDAYFGYDPDHDVLIAITLGSIGADAIEPLMALLQHEDPRKRRCAAGGFEHMVTVSPRPDHPELIGKLYNYVDLALQTAYKNEQHEKTREAIADALGAVTKACLSLRDDEINIVEPVVAKLNDKNPRVRESTCLTLRILASHAAENIGFLVTDDKIIQKAQFISKLVDPATNALQSLLDREQDENVSNAAREALAKIKEAQEKMAKFLINRAK